MSRGARLFLIIDIIMFPFRDLSTVLITRPFVFFFRAKLILSLSCLESSLVITIGSSREITILSLEAALVARKRVGVL